MECDPFYEIIDTLADTINRSVMVNNQYVYGFVYGKSNESNDWKSLPICMFGIFNFTKL